MKTSYKIVFIISLLLLVLTLAISIINYKVSLDTAQNQLKKQALPLSLDNIYTEIQKYIIEPYLISSMMSNDTFVKDWLKNSENKTEKISDYLLTIKDKYKMFSTFLVSNYTKKYYSYKGYEENILLENTHNKWYYDFVKQEKDHEINLDFNKNFTRSLMMFINYKIKDKNGELVGVTGIGLKISYIHEMLKMFREKYNLKVSFFNINGETVLAEKDFNYKNIDEIKHLKFFKKQIMSPLSSMQEYDTGFNKIIINSKFIPELNLYLVVEASVNDFVREIKRMFYINLFISLLITLVITIIIIYVIKKYHEKLHRLANNDSLTKISNRRNFNDNFELIFKYKKRIKKNLCVVFMDIDNFKKINDDLGHSIGDEVLKEVANVLKNNIQKNDLLARWGGEEFILSLNLNSENAINLANKLCKQLQDNKILKELSPSGVTGSFGVSELLEDDTIDSLLIRADKAMYHAKEEGKNRVCFK